MIITKTKESKNKNTRKVSQKTQDKDFKNEVKMHKTRLRKEEEVKGHKIRLRKEVKDTRQD